MWWKEAKGIVNPQSRDTLFLTQRERVETRPTTASSTSAAASATAGVMTSDKAPRRRRGRSASGGGFAGLFAFGDYLVTEI